MFRTIALLLTFTLITGSAVAQEKSKVFRAGIRPGHHAG